MAEEKAEKNPEQRIWVDAINYSMYCARIEGLWDDLVRYKGGGSFQHPMNMQTRNWFREGAERVRQSAEEAYHEAKKIEERYKGVVPKDTLRADGLRIFFYESYDKLHQRISSLAEEDEKRSK